MRNYICGIFFLTALIAGPALAARKVTYTPSAKQTMTLQQASDVVGNINEACLAANAAANAASGETQAIADKLCSISDAPSFPDSEGVISSFTIVHDRLEVTDGNNAHNKYSIPLDKLSVSAGIYTVSSIDYERPALFLNGWAVSFDKADSMDFYHKAADAIAVMIGDVAARNAAFERAAESYRNAKVKPVPGENVRRYEVMAEEAIRDKHFSEAVDDYRAGLKIAPWWPQGHFNTAMVLGELRYYDGAIDEMKKYLALVPDAPNARAARDQMYRWQSEAREASVQW